MSSHLNTLSSSGGSEFPMVVGKEATNSLILFLSRDGGLSSLYLDLGGSETALVNGIHQKQCCASFWAQDLIIDCLLSTLGEANYQVRNLAIMRLPCCENALASQLKATQRAVPLFPAQGSDA